MTERLELYKCEVCGNTVQVILEGFGQLTCCGQPMLKMLPKTNDENFAEKHVPVFNEREAGLEIKVGSIPHPMENEHYIMFMEAISKDKNRMLLQYLYPNDEPKTVIRDIQEVENALEFCNIHG